MDKGEDKILVKISSHDANKLSWYLIGKQVGAEVIDRYEMAVQIKQLSMNLSEQKIWSLMLNYNIVLASVDSCLALSNRHSPIRQRIFIMLAILEAHPDYFYSFYKKKLRFLDHFNLFFLLFTSPFKIMLGILIIIFFKLKI